MSEMNNEMVNVENEQVNETGSNRDFGIGVGVGAGAALLAYGIGKGVQALVRHVKSKKKDGEQKPAKEKKGIFSKLKKEKKEETQAENKESNTDEVKEGKEES